METTALQLTFLVIGVAVLSALGGGLLARAIAQPRQGKDEAQEDLRPAGETVAGERELLRVVRTGSDRLNVVVHGRRYHHLREITDSRTGYETVEALKAVLGFAEGWLPALVDATLRPARETPSGDQEAFLKHLRQNDTSSGSGIAGPIDWLRKPISSSPSAGPLRTPAEQIDDAIQRRLRKRPELAGQSIRLSTGPDGGLRIHVGLQVYDAVDDVPDPQARALIQEAIREWEAS
jgi:hypothetical protein